MRDFFASPLPIFASARGPQKIVKFFGVRNDIDYLVKGVPKKSETFWGKNRELVRVSSMLLLLHYLLVIFYIIIVSFGEQINLTKLSLEEGMEEDECISK